MPDDEQRDGDVLAGDRGRDECVEHLVEAEDRGSGVGPAPLAGECTEQVEHTTVSISSPAAGPLCIHTARSAAPAAQPSATKMAPTSSSGASIHSRCMTAAPSVSVHRTNTPMTPGYPGRSIRNAGVAVPAISKKIIE